MRKVILFIATSLDGYIASKDGSVDWLFTDSDYGTTAFLKSVDTILMGRKTYVQALGFGLNYYAGKKIYVFSRSKKLTPSDQIGIINAEPVAFINKLKKRKGKNIWLMGGGEIASTFQQNKLIDEYYLFVHPVILGKGIPLFNKITSGENLKLINYRKFESGLVKFYYKSRD